MPTTTTTRTGNTTCSNPLQINGLGRIGFYMLSVSVLPKRKPSVARTARDST